MQMSLSQPQGKLSTKDATTARVLQFAPWIAVLATSIPAPLLFLVLFLTATATDSAAVFLLLAGLSLGKYFRVARASRILVSESSPRRTLSPCSLLSAP